MSRRMLVGALTLGAMAGALISYVAGPRQPATEFTLPPEVTPQIEKQLRCTPKRQGPRIIDTHPLEHLKGSPFPPDVPVR